MADKMSRSYIANRLSSIQAEPRVWTQPDAFDLSNAVDVREVERRLDSGLITKSIDRIAEIADDLFEMKNPHLKSEERARHDFKEEIAAQNETFGTWFHFEWSDSLVRFPDKDDHQDLRTFRNKELITHEEQRKLLTARIAIFGLSVGSNIHEQLIQSGIGGEVMIGDFDILTPTNLNRIRAGMPDVGMRKLDIAAIKTSELDPYVKQVHFSDGLNEETFSELAENKPDLLFDEIDNLAMKAMLRKFAKEHGVPVMMATDVDERSIIDIERYDLDARTKLFNGKMSEKDVDALLAGDMSEAERQKAMIKMVGVQNLTPRILQSSMQIGTTLGGLPQLGSTAAEGGVLSVTATRDLLLGRKVPSGRYVSNMRKPLSLPPISTRADALHTVADFIRASNAKKS